MSVIAPAILFKSSVRVCLLVSYSALRLFILGTRIHNVAPRDPKVKRIRGELHMRAHGNLTTRDESVKRGGGGVTIVEICTPP